MIEMSREQAEAAAGKLPLPSFESQEDEIWNCQQWAARRSKGVACIVLGLSKNHLKTEWRKEKRILLESKRFQQWCETTCARWDIHRGKFMVMNPLPCQPT
jgi:hypothetical protein